MPSLEISDQLYTHLLTLADAGVKFEAPPNKGCTHWSVYADGQQFACACQPERLRTIFSALEKLSETVLDHRAEHEMGAGEQQSEIEQQGAVPTPAQVVSHPLKFTPPAFVRRQRIQFLPAVLRWMEGAELEESYILDIIDDPDEVVPAAEWRTIYRRDGLDVVFAERDFLVLSINSSSEAEGEGLQRLPGQKPKRRLPVPSDVDGMIALMESRGFEVEHGGKHWKVTHPGSEAVASMPYTPSDYRWAQNMVAEVRTKFGIDLREKQD